MPRPPAATEPARRIWPRPQPIDLDGKNRCWWYSPGGGEYVPSYRLCEDPKDPRFTHWAPYYSFPAPDEEGTAPPDTRPTDDKKPLWLVMADAYAKATGASSLCGHSALIARGNAAEIRALRDWLVPDEPEPPMARVAVGYEDAYTRKLEEDRLIWQWNQRLRGLLSAAAKRAEEGDGGP